MKISQYLFFIAILFVLQSLFSTVSAQRYVLENSKVHFFSSAPMEDIEATNEACKGVIDTKTNSFAFRIPIKSFVFPSSLMQQHFNENYMDSEKYPNASFKGKIEGDYDLTKDGTYDVMAVGDLEIHGKKQPRKIPSQIIVQGGKASIKSTFNVKLEDHAIKIPSLMFQKIAETVKVDMNSDLKLYDKK
ncbi:YceI family protein [Bernardetia sp.]|uniref:YceI family protein n=1 Tax=Bernardetia sp. TaxID=1937974 RepID=UPI0025BCD387|nr:YceI family protein [Bernardetia sp.]